MTATFFDSFDDELQNAENEFLNLNFDKAVQHWKQYYKITARIEYKHIIDEIVANWQPEVYGNISGLPQLFSLFTDLRTRFFNKEISHYTKDLYQKLLVKKYTDIFRGKNPENLSTETGIFEYLSGHNDPAILRLQQTLEQNPEAVIARTFLGYAYLAKKEQMQAVKALTKNLFLAADQVKEDDLYLSQFKLLLGRLYADHSNWAVASWLLCFESWYRNYLVFEEDHQFFVMMQQKESNERILQVKYYQSERFRHFVRCLYIAEYSRQFLKKNKGLISEQERYMEKLDAQLFARYRKKRKELKA